VCPASLEWQGSRHWAAAAAGACGPATVSSLEAGEYRPGLAGSTPELLSTPSIKLQLKVSRPSQHKISFLSQYLGVAEKQVKTFIK